MIMFFVPECRFPISEEQSYLCVYQCICLSGDFVERLPLISNLLHWILLKTPLKKALRSRMEQQVVSIVRTLDNSAEYYSTLNTGHTPLFNELLSRKLDSLVMYHSWCAAVEHFKDGKKIKKLLKKDLVFIRRYKGRPCEKNSVREVKFTRS